MKIMLPIEKNNLTRCFRAGALVLLLLAAAPALANPSGGGRTQTEEAMLLASDGEEAARFGSSVGLSGDAAICGAPYTSGYYPSTGFAYVYRHNPATGAWDEEQKLLASEGEINDYFGVAAAIWGNTAVVGADCDDAAGTYSGEAYVFEYDPGTGSWSELQRVIGSDTSGNDRFGGDCDIVNDVMLIAGSRNDDLGSDSGSAYIFRYDSGTGYWAEEQKLLASDGASADYFGFELALGDGVAIVGAPYDDDNGADSGSAYVFRYDPGSGTWFEEQKLTASDGEGDDKFGWGLSISGNLALVGAIYDDDQANSCGSAYVFRYDEGSGLWVEEQKLLPKDGNYLDYFGYSVAITDNIALVGNQNDDDAGGDSGSVYVFRYSPGAAKWIFEEKLLASNNPASAQMGSCLCVDTSALGVKVLAGAPREDTTIADAGAAYLFDISGGGNPVIDIKINGEDDPGLIWHQETAAMTISLYPFSQTGLLQDWWVIGRANSTNLYYWVYPTGWGSTPARAHVGPLFELDGYLFCQAKIPYGNWEFAFAVDAPNYAFEGTYMDVVEIYSY